MSLAPRREPMDPTTIGDASARALWAANRFWMETANIKTKRWGGKGPHHWYALLYLMKAFQWLLRATGRYAQGTRNAERLTVREVTLSFGDLPPAFDGFTIMHLSDLHLDGMPGLPERVCDAIASREVDLAVLTGDYRTELRGGDPHRAPAARARPGAPGVGSNPR